MDGTVEEPAGGAHRDPQRAMEAMGRAICDHLDELAGIPKEELLAARREKFRRIAAIEGRFPVVA